MKLFLHFLFLLLFFSASMASAGGELIIFDRSGGAMNLQKLLGFSLAGKGLQLPGDLDITVKNKLDQKDLKNVLMAEEAFAPVENAELFEAFDYALLPVIVAVPLSLPLESLTLDELKKIYSGRITDWKVLNLPAGRVRIAGCANNTPQMRVFRALVMKQNIFSPGAPEIGSEIVPDMLTCRSSEAASLLQTVDGLIVFGSLELLSDAQGKYKILKLDGIAPDKENLISGRYPLQACHRVRYLRRSRSPEFAGIIKFLKNSAARNPEMIAVEK